MFSKLLVLSAAGLALVLPANGAFAGSKIFSSGSTVLVVNGSVETNANGNRDPFIAQVFSAGGGECLRIAVTSQGADLEAVLVSPSGAVWRDDDSGGSNRPLIRAVTDTRGWYLLSISQAAGAAVNADFTMTVQRATAGSRSPLCSGAAPPLGVASASTLAKAGSNGPAPSNGANTR